MNRKQRRQQATFQPRRDTAPVRQPASNAAAVGAALAAAVQHFQAARFDRAEAILGAVLKAQPSHPVALHLLGAIALQAGRNETAVELIGKAVALKPDDAEAHSNLGNALMNQGKHGKAAASYKKAIALRPDYAKAYMNLGIARVFQDKLDAAVAAFRSAIAIAPNEAPIHNNLGGALMRQGKLDEAMQSFQTAVALNPNSAEAHYNLGNALKDQGKLGEAIASFREAIVLKPGYTEARNNLGNALKNQGRLDEAVASYREAIAHNHHNAEAHSSLGTALKDLGRVDEAVAAHKMAIDIRPDFAEAHYNLGNALKDHGKLEEAFASYRKAIALKPDYAEAYINLGDALADHGKLEEAIASYRKAIKIRPAYFEAYYNHALVHGFGPSDPEIDKLKELLARDEPSSDQRTLLRFALGKAHDDIGRYDEAFSYFSAANDEMAGRLNFAASRHRKKITEIKRAFPERRVSGGDNSEEGERVPVFLVGMSRSGKTLVESLLSQHDHAHGCGESPAWLGAENSVLDKYSIPRSFPECMDYLTNDHVREIGRAYMENLVKSFPSLKLFINTLPGTYLSVGIILQALPAARIIHSQRNSIDNCLFMYMRHYPKGHDYSYDLSHLASYYAGYNELMAHWQKLYGDCILSVRYEDLVRNPTDVSARIYEFCGLDHDPEALRHAFTTGGIGHWKHYEPYLDTLRQALGRLAAHSTRQ